MDERVNKNSSSAIFLLMPKGLILCTYLGALLCGACCSGTLKRLRLSLQLQRQFLVPEG